MDVADHVGLQTMEQSALAGLAARQPAQLPSPIRATEMFGFNSYDGGAVVLHALRKTIGDDKFFDLLRRWVADNNGAIADRPRTSSRWPREVCGQDLTEFFDTWLYADTCRVVPDAAPVSARRDDHDDPG